MMWLAVLLLAGGAVYLTRDDARREQIGDAKSLAGWVPPGWRVAGPPDRPGPYHKVDESAVYAPGHVGGFTYNTPTGPRTVRVTARADVRQQLLLLRAADGELTIAVLEQ